MEKIPGWGMDGSFSPGKDTATQFPSAPKYRCKSIADIAVLQQAIILVIWRKLSGFQTKFNVVVF